MCLEDTSVSSEKEVSFYCIIVRGGYLVPYIAVSVPQDFVQYMAELPAENGAAGQREAQSVGPEGVGSLLPVSPQDDSYCCVVKEAQPITALLAIPRTTCAISHTITLFFSPL